MRSVDVRVPGPQRPLATAGGGGWAGNRPSYVYGNVGELLDTNINRSPSAYDNNPAEERAQYAYNCDKDMSVVKIVGTDGENRGLISWFRTSPPSMPIRARGPAR